MRYLLTFLLFGAAMLIAAQTRADSTRPRKPATTPRTPPGRPLHNVRVGFVDSLKQPESVLYDAAQDVYFVSNIEGQSLAKDGRGFISRLHGDGTVDARRWIQSGERGAMLNAPKGMALRHDTLWVADIDAVRGFNTHTGAVVATVDLHPLGAVFLNDVAFGPDGMLYVTDTRLKPDSLGNMVPAGTSTIYRLDGSWKPAVAIASDRLARPNGIAWDVARAAFIVVPLGGDTVVSWKPGSSDVTPLATGAGSFDGLVLAAGHTWIASKATGSVHVVVGSKLPKAIENLGDVADMDYNTKRGVLAVVLTSENRVVFYKVGDLK
jgi:sugar lactone lactonase YvrE